MDVFDILKEDHKKVAKILKEGDETTSAAIKTREKIYEHLKKEFLAHAKMEETFFYPPLKERDETKDLILESYEEHNLVKQLLSELGDLEPEDETWGAKFSVLKENIEHHVQEEENELFSKVKKALSHKELDEIAERMQQFKKENNKK